MTQPLHHLRHLDDLNVSVCAHCWDLVLLGDRAALSSARPRYEQAGDVPEVVLWPCPTASRTLDLLAQELDADFILGVARAEHELFEQDYEEEDREVFEDLDPDDQAFILHESAVWLEAIRRHATRGLL